MIPYRKQMQLASNASIVAGSFRHVWKFIRKYPNWLSKVYERLYKVAERRNCKIPKTNISMEVEK